MSNAETKLMAAIVDALAWDSDVIVVRVHSGKVKVRGGWMVLADEGTSDLLLCVGPRGRWCALEVKTPGGTTKPSREKAQGEFLKSGRLIGGFGARVRSVGEAREAVQRCKNGLSQ